MQNTAVVRVGDLDAFVRPAWEAAERIEPTECLHHVEYLAFILGAASLVSTPDRMPWADSRSTTSSC